MTDDSSGSRSRALLIVGAVVVSLAALVSFVIVPLLGGDDPDVVGTPDDGTVEGPEPTPAPTSPPGVAASEAPEADDPPVETFEVFNVRDPFQQLVRAADGGEGADQNGMTPTDPGTTTPTDPGTTTPGDPGTSPTDPGTTPTDPGTSPADPGPTPTEPDGGSGNGTGTGTGTGGAGAGDSNARMGAATVTLVDVFTGDDGDRRATVIVNGTGYTVGEGATFGRNFRLLDISGECATMLFGDSRFTLCEGERIQK